MALAPTQPTNGGGGSGTDATSFTTGTITPNTARPVTIGVCHTGSTPPAQPTVSGTEGWNGTFTLEETLVYNLNNRISVYSIVPVSNTDGTITFDFGSETQTRCNWKVIEWAEGNTSAFIVQSPAGSTANSTAPAEEVASLASSSNGIVMYVAYNNAFVTFAADSGWTEIGAEVQNEISIAALWALGGGDLTPSATLSSGVHWAALALEVAAAAAGATPGAGNYYQYYVRNVAAA